MAVYQDDEAKAARKATRKALRKAERKEARQTVHEQPMHKEEQEVAPPAKRARLDEEASATVAAYLISNEITIHEADAPTPCLSLSNAPFPPALVKMLMQQGFSAPSPVQAASWPVATMGRDVLAIAKTGSGKTLGFLLPVLARCIAEKVAAKGAPLGLIMAPTRELALQIHAEANKFGRCVGCTSVAVYGGAARQAQVNSLRRGCELIIGTPGRIKDVLDTRGNGVNACTPVGKLSMLVLDEADRMLDMGFEHDIRSIVWQAFAGLDGNSYRAHQTFLYSATWPLEVQGIASDLLTNAVKVTVGSGGEKLTASKSVEQRVHVIQSGQRWDAFRGLIAPFCKRAGGKDAGTRVLVFANRKDTVKALAKYCTEMGMACEQLSGDRSQSQRESTLKRFKEGSVTVVIATDVAARGLDIKGIERVINFELPVDDFQDYVHRIGRTGRASATGRADSLFTDSDKMHAKELIRILNEAGQLVPPALAKLTPQRVVFDD